MERGWTCLGLHDVSDCHEESNNPIACRQSSQELEACFTRAWVYMTYAQMTRMCTRLLISLALICERQMCLTTTSACLIWMHHMLFVCNDVLVWMFLCGVYRINISTSLWLYNMR